MKTFLAMFFAALLGAGAALALYHTLWLQPQLRALGASGDAPAAAGAQAGGQAVSDAVPPEAAATAATAPAERPASPPEDDASRIDAVREAVRQATMFRVALTEYRASQGRWPRNADEAGLPAPDQTRQGAVEAIGVGAEGRVELRLDPARFAPGSRIVLRPLRDDARGADDWACEIAGDAVLTEALPKCRR